MTGYILRLCTGDASRDRLEIAETLTWLAGMLAIAMLVFGFAYLLTFGGKDTTLARIDDFDWLESPAASLQELPADDAIWRPASIGHFSIFRKSGWIRARFRHKRAPGASQPLALRFSGFFAAELYLNGTLIGTNGVPGATAATEQPGRIDYSFPLPADTLKEGDNILLARVSNHRALMPARFTIHYFRIIPYTAEPGRPLVRYLPSLLALGLLSAMLLWYGRTHSRFGAGWLDYAPFIAISALIAQLGFELARPLIDYAYPAHFWRFFGMAGAACLFGLALAIHIYQRFWRNMLPLAIAMGAGAVIAVVALSDTQDGRILLIHASLISLAVAGAICGVVKHQPGARQMTGALLIFPLTYVLLPFDYLDQGIFLAGAFFFLSLGPALPRRTRLLARQINAPRLPIRSNGREYWISTEKICFCRGQGNYSEINTIDGRSHLYGKGIGALGKVLPGQFFRVHKSYIVNMNYVAELKIRQGSRYSLQMKTGQTVPLSRLRVREARFRLGISADTPKAAQRTNQDSHLPERPQPSEK